MEPTELSAHRGDAQGPGRSQPTRGSTAECRVCSGHRRSCPWLRSREWPMLVSTSFAPSVRAWLAGRVLWAWTPGACGSSAFLLLGAVWSLFCLGNAAFWWLCGCPSPAQVTCGKFGARWHVWAASSDTHTGPLFSNSLEVLQFSSARVFLCSLVFWSSSWSF